MYNLYARRHGTRTCEQCVSAYVADGEAYDRGLVQMEAEGGWDRQETGQVTEHVGLCLSPQPGCFTTNGPGRKGGSAAMEEETRG